MHLYGGAAAMRSGAMPLQWEGKCLVQELFVALSFSFAFAFALACSFSKTFDGSFRKEEAKFTRFHAKNFKASGNSN